MPTRLPRCPASPARALDAFLRVPLRPFAFLCVALRFFAFLCVPLRSSAFLRVTLRSFASAVRRHRRLLRILIPLLSKQKTSEKVLHGHRHMHLDLEHGGVASRRAKGVMTGIQVGRGQRAGGDASKKLHQTGVREVACLDAAYVGQPYHGEVCMHFAIVHHDMEMLKLLVSNGADTRTQHAVRALRPSNLTTTAPLMELIRSTSQRPTPPKTTEPELVLICPSSRP